MASARALIGVLLGLMLLPSTAAAAELSRFPAQHGRSYPFSDGVRYVLINRAPGVIRVLDTRTGRGRDVTVRDMCAARGATANWGLVTCNDDPNPWLMRLSTRRMAPINFGSSREMNWSGIGRHWLVGHYTINRPVVVYTAWREDERGRRDGFSGDGFESPRFDPDDPALRPISDQHVIFDRDGNGVLKDLRKARGTDTRLVLDRGSRRVVLSRCPRGCSNGTLSAGVATWREGRRVHAYVERTRRRGSWTASNPNTIVHTRTHVIVAESNDQPPYTPDLFWARLPR